MKEGGEEEKDNGGLTTQKLKKGNSDESLLGPKQVSTKRYPMGRLRYYQPKRKGCCSLYMMLLQHYHRIIGSFFNDSYHRIGRPIKSIGNVAQLAAALALSGLFLALEMDLLVAGLVTIGAMRVL